MDNEQYKGQDKNEMKVKVHCNRQSHTKGFLGCVTLVITLLDIFSHTNFHTEIELKASFGSSLYIRLRFEANSHHWKIRLRLLS